MRRQARQIVTDVLFECRTCNIEEEALRGRKAMRNQQSKAIRHMNKGHDARVSVTRLIIYDGR